MGLGRLVEAILELELGIMGLELMDLMEELLDQEHRGRKLRRHKSLHQHRKGKRLLQKLLLKLHQHQLNQKFKLSNQHPFQEKLHLQL